jgi:hypothetical protein
VRPEGGLYYVCGVGHLVAAGPTIAGTFDGTIGYQAIARNDSTAKECPALDHHMTFVRQ